MLNTVNPHCDGQNLAGHLKKFVDWGGVEAKRGQLGTSATNWPIVPVAEHLVFK
jgi:hypothetical protein